MKEEKEERERGGARRRQGTGRGHNELDDFDFLPRMLTLISSQLKRRESANTGKDLVVSSTQFELCWLSQACEHSVEVTQRSDAMVLLAQRPLPLTPMNVSLA